MWGSWAQFYFSYIYINDLPSSTKSKVRLIADDTAINLAVSSLEDAQSLQQDLDHLNKWELEWNMEFDPSKCVVIRDYLMAFWLSPEVSNRDPIITCSFTCSSRANNGRGIKLRAITKTPCYNLFITFSISLFQRVLGKNVSTTEEWRKFCITASHLFTSDVII